MSFYKNFKLPKHGHWQALCFFIALANGAIAQSPAQGVMLNVQLRGVYQSNITLQPFKNGRWATNSKYVASAFNGQTISLQVDSADLPGEFILRYDYRSTASDQPYPAEQPIFISNQNISLQVHPLYCNNADSMQYAPDERENNLWRSFTAEKAKRMQQLQLLQPVLMAYDNPKAPMYAAVRAEYGRRLKAFNGWLAGWQQQYADYYVSSLFQFSRLPQINFSGTEQQRYQSVVNNYLKGLRFTHPGLTRTAEFTNWLTAYVNLQAEKAKNQPQLDSILRAAATRMIDTVRKGHSLVYGFVVDYFFEGFERSGMSSAASILEPYLQDPRCLTRKQQAINKRLSGLKYLKPGMQLKGVLTENIAGQQAFHPLVADTGAATPVLVVFYYSDCEHCTQFLKELQAWYRQPGNSGRLRVVSVCVDADKATWKAYAGSMQFAWADGYAPGGINSEAAADYYVLSTPALFFGNPQGRLLSMPGDMKKLTELLSIPYSK